MNASDTDILEFIEIADQLYGIKSMCNPGRIADVTDPIDLLILNHPRSTTGIWCILNVTKSPVMEAPDYGMIPQFAARVNRGSFTDYLSRGCFEYWFLFWISFSAETRNGYSVLPLTGLWLTTVGKAEKEFRLNPPPVLGEDWIVDVRRFRQIRFNPLTSEDNKV